MYEAHSLKSISKKMDSALPRKICYSKKEPVISSRLDFVMTPDMDLLTKCKTIKIEEKNNSKLIGILIANPNSPLAKSEIINHLPQFHIRSGEAIDIFCVGYGAYWPPEHYADQKPVVTIEGIDWLFSEQAFSNIIDDLMNNTKWKFSGETELILVAAIKNKIGKINIDYGNAIVCNLEAMSKDNAFTSVRAFFEGLFIYAKQHSRNNPAWGYSDQVGIGIAKSAIKDAILSLIPENLRQSYRRASHSAIRDIS